MQSDEQLNKFKTLFKDELDGITDIEELKELFALEIARRDVIIDELQKQNQIILNSAFKNKKEQIELEKSPSDSP
jgi:hypothetical protein